MGPSQFCTEHRDSTLFKERAIPFLIVRKCFYILIFQSQRSFIFICEWKSCCTYENNFAWACLLRVIFFRWAMWPAGFLFKFWYRLKKKTNQSALHLGKIDCNSEVWFLAVPSPPKVKKKPQGSGMTHDVKVHFLTVYSSCLNLAGHVTQKRD